MGVYGFPAGLPKRPFEERYRRLLGPDYEAFLRYTARMPVPSIRVNPMKLDPDILLSRLRRGGWILEGLPWYRHGFRVISGPAKLGNTPEHQLGLYYVQEAASMAPPVALDPRPGERVLDLAAAPGSKTTQMAEMMGWRGVVVANDPSPSRANSLAANVQRMGSINVVVTSYDGRTITRHLGEGVFDAVLLDAPCSAVGAARRDWTPLRRWSLRSVRRISRLQVSLALEALRSLRPGGRMVYSTCTLDPEENEFVIHRLLSEGAEVEEVSLPGMVTRPGLTRWEGRELDPSLARPLRI